MTDFSRKPLYIFDLDGTLRNCKHRLPILESTLPDKWPRFFKACVLDKPILSTINTMHYLIRAGADVIFFSGCGEEARNETIDWLSTNTELNHEDLTAETLIMRPAGDYDVEDQELKRAWYQALPLEDKKRLVAVFEDRARVVEMWREEGVVCYQVDKGDF
jgi:FMN phosphatase YigB (HAD superfamily)